MPAGEISEEVIYDPTEKLCTSKARRSVFSGPVWRFTSGARRR